MSASLKRGAVSFALVRHDSHCPMSRGEGTACAEGCRPVLEFVDKRTYIEATTRRKPANRAERRAAAKAERRAGKGGARC